MTQTDPAADSDDSARFMLTALHTTHQHADAKAGILAAAQTVLVGTAGTWSRQAVHAWREGGATGTLALMILVLFVCGLLGGAGSLAAALRPRILRSPDGNRYSFVHLASGPNVPPDEATSRDAAAERYELSYAVRFLARVALLKYRYLMSAVVCTALMGAGAGLGVLLQSVFPR